MLKDDRNSLLSSMNTYLTRILDLGIGNITAIEQAPETAEWIVVTIASYRKLNLSLKDR